jgi:DNA-binding NarL/FixJ family response regulator
MTSPFAPKERTRAPRVEGMGTMSSASLFAVKVTGLGIPHGRDDYLDRITANLRRVANTQEARTVTVEGEQGSGKTRLLAHAAELAEAQGFATFCGIFEQFGKSADSELVPESTAVQTNHVYARLADLLRHGPVLVTLDDAHWASPSTILAVRTLMTKLRGRPVLWLLSFRPDDRAGLSALLTHEVTRTEQLPELPPLTPAAIGSLATDLLGVAPSQKLRSILESVSTPGPLVELIRGLMDDEVIHVGDEIAELTAIHPEQALPLRFVTMVNAKIDLLAGQVRQLLQVAAVLGNEFAPTDLATMLGKSPAELLPIIHEAMRAGLIEANVYNFVFSSAPIWLAVLETVPTPVRVMLHRQAAQIMLSHASGRVAAATHLAQGALPGDAEAVRVLTEVSQELLSCDPGHAADLAARGMRLCVAGTGEYLELAVISAHALTRSGSLQAAIELCGRSMESISQDTPSALALRHWMSTALLLRGQAVSAAGTAKRLLDTPACVGATREQAEVVRLAAESLSDEGAATARAEEILSEAKSSVPGVMTAARSALALSRWRSGQVIEALELTRPGEQAGPWFSDPTWLRTSLLTRLRRLGEVERIIELSKPETLDTTSGIPVILSAAMRLANGDLDEAVAQAELGLKMATTHDMPLYAPQGASVLAMVALHRGDLVAAARYARQIEELLPREQSRPWWATSLLVQGMVATAAADTGAITDILTAAHQDAGTRREMLLEDPAAAGWFVRTALATGRHCMAEAMADTAEVLSAANPGITCLEYSALHARALLGQDEETLAAVARYHDDPLVRAFATEDLGILLSTGNRDAAVEQLDQAMIAYGSAGATWHTARVTRRLRTLGVRRRNWKHTTRPVTGWDSLTSTEQKVATLVSQGLTNRQAASHLFVSPHTVGFHLRQIFRKLGIGSRIELVQMHG